MQRVMSSDHHGREDALNRESLHHSRRAKPANTIAVVQSATINSHSKRPEWRSGSRPNSCSTQSCQSKVNTAKRAVAKPRADSTQKTERSCFTGTPCFPSTVVSENAGLRGIQRMSSSGRLDLVVSRQTRVASPLRFAKYTPQCSAVKGSGHRIWVKMHDQAIVNDIDTRFNENAYPRIPRAYSCRSRKESRKGVGSAAQLI